MAISCSLGLKVDNKIDHTISRHICFFQLTQVIVNLIPTDASCCKVTFDSFRLMQAVLIDTLKNPQMPLVAWDTRDRASTIFEMDETFSQVMGGVRRLVLQAVEYLPPLET